MLFAPAWNRTRRRLSRRASSVLGAALTDKQAGKRVEKYKDLAVKLLSAPLKNDNVEKMNRLQAERIQP